MAKDNKDNKENKKSFFKDFKSELKKVSWPTFDELVKKTGAVLVIVLITAVIIFVLDVIFKSLNEYGVNNLKKLVTSDSEIANVIDENVVSNEAVDTTISDATTENVVENVVAENVVSE